MNNRFKTNIDVSLLEEITNNLKIKSDNACALLKLNDVYVYLYHSSKRSGKIRLNIKVYSQSNKGKIIYSLDFNRNKDTFEKQIPFYSESILSKLSDILYNNYFKSNDKTFEFGLFDDFEERFNNYISSEVNNMNEVCLFYTPLSLSEDNQETALEEGNEGSITTAPFIYQEMQ